MVLGTKKRRSFLNDPQPNLPIKITVFYHWPLWRIKEYLFILCD